MTDLQEQVDLLRAAISELEEAQANSATGQQIEELHTLVESTALAMDARLDEIRRVLVGDISNEGAVDILAGLTKTVESIGRVIETLHREGQLKNEVLESIIPRISLEKAWKSVALMWQSFIIAQTVAEQRQ